MMPRSPVDDRGVPYQPVALAELALRADSQAERDAARNLQRDLKRVRDEASRRWSMHRFLLAAPATLVVLVVVFPTLLWLFGGRVGLIGGVLAALVAFAVTQQIERSLAMRRIQRGIGATLSAHGFCARCGYTLRGLERQADGTAICSECGTAWSVSRVTRPHWEGTQPPLTEKPPVVLRVLLLNPPIVNDDRGVLVRRTDTWLIGVGRSRRQSLGEDRIRSLRHALRVEGRWIRWPLTAVLGASTLSALFQFTRIGSLEGADWIIAVVGIVALSLALGLGTFSTLTGELGITPRRFGAATTERGLCAACLGELRPPDPEGYRVCIACGATWQAPTEPGQRRHPPA
ncbi:MAG TPA: hypothetical protein PLU35_01540 [Phycisphaerales bacterium]|nr:hypothetical protein [Phycisphaerales bacterium]